MAIVNTSLHFSHNFTPTSIKPTMHLNCFHPYLPFSCHHHRDKKDFSVLAAASSSHQPINVDYLEREFGGHGVSFAGIGESCVVKMGLDNGSMATLMLPSGLITSYKAHMWHGSTLEVLHTTVSEGEDGGAVVQGGVSVGLTCGSVGELSWSPSTWALQDVRGSAENSIQVELISSDSRDMVEVKYIVELHPDLISSELVISNMKSSSLQLMGSVISHLTVSTPDATYAVGLEGSNYYSKPPLMSGFSIIPPNIRQEKKSSPSQLWDQTPLQGWLSQWGTKEQKEAAESESVGRETEQEMEREENDNNVQLTEKMSRIYTSAPRRFTIIDRGRRNSVVLGREGFDELYIFSPGSNYEWYGKYAYICTGPSAMLKPMTVGAESVWRGVQYLHNPNL